MPVMRAKGWRLGVVDTSNVPYEQGTAATGRYVAWLSECAEGSTIFMNTEVTSRVPVSYWTYFAFTGKVLRKRDAGTIARWYDFEIRKFRTDPEAHAVLDDPDALSH